MRFGEEFPQINCLPGPGSYNWDTKSMKNNQIKASKYQPFYARKSSRFDSQRNSLVSHNNSPPEIIEAPLKSQKRIKIRKSPMKSSLSNSPTKKSNNNNSVQGIIYNNNKITYLEFKVCPGKYNPNFNAIKKNVPSISLGPHTTK